MKKPRILITGGSGLLAINWACTVRNNWDVILGTHKHDVTLENVSTFKLELDDVLLLDKQLDHILPDLIVHTAGLTSVDRCEKEPVLAEQVNGSIAKNIAMVAASKNIDLVHISTDHLFSGKNRFYQEDALVDPVNEYGRTKALAEKWVQAENCDALIVRTNFFCWGHQYRQSFSDWLIYSLREGKKLNLFDDVFFTPILADTLVSVIHELVEKRVSGVYNLVGDERISKYDFAVAICKEFSLPTSLIRREQVENANLQAKRPQDMSLDNQKVQEILGKKVGTAAQFLSILHAQEAEGRRLELLNAVN